MGRRSPEERRKAAGRAAREYLRDFSGNQSQAAASPKAKAAGLKQQHFSWAIKDQKLGEGTVDRFAALFETTPDGLVSRFPEEGGAEPQGMTLRDVHGWAAAKRAARNQLEGKVDDWVWSAIDHVVVPVPLKKATEEFVKRIAHLLDEWGQVSRERTKVSAKAE